MYKRQGNGDSTWCEVDGTEILSAEKPRDFNIQYAFPLHLEITWAPIEDRGPLEPVSYTHLDVYKRQAPYKFPYPH